MQEGGHDRAAIWQPSRLARHITGFQVGSRREVRPRCQNFGGTPGGAPPGVNFGPLGAGAVDKVASHVGILSMTSGSTWPPGARFILSWPSSRRSSPLASRAALASGSDRPPCNLLVGDFAAILGKADAIFASDIFVPRPAPDLKMRFTATLKRSVQKEPKSPPCNLLAGDGEFHPGKNRER